MRIWRTRWFRILRPSRAPASTAIAGVYIALAVGRPCRSPCGRGQAHRSPGSRPASKIRSRPPMFLQPVMRNWRRRSAEKKAGARVVRDSSTNDGIFRGSPIAIRLRDRGVGQGPPVGFGPSSTSALRLGVARARRRARDASAFKGAATEFSPPRGSCDAPRSRRVFSMLGLFG